MSYKRMNFAVETYPMVNHIISPGLTNARGDQSWTTFGMGTRVDYRLRHYLSATLDMTSSFIGGPAALQTADAVSW